MKVIVNKGVELINVLQHISDCEYKQKVMQFLKETHNEIGENF